MSIINNVINDVQAYANKSGVALASSPDFNNLDVTEKSKRLYESMEYLHNYVIPEKNLRDAWHIYNNMSIGG